MSRTRDGKQSDHGSTGFLYPALGFAVEQEVPDDVRAAYERLIEAGFTSRLVKWRLTVTLCRR
jgi:hypothetical protein